MTMSARTPSPTGARRVRVFAPVALPHAAAGSWIIVRCGLETGWSGFVAVVDLLDEEGAVRNGPFEFRAGPGGMLEAIAYASVDVAATRVTVIGHLPPDVERIEVQARRTTRFAALLRLARRETGGLARLGKTVRSPRILSLGPRLRTLGLDLVRPGLQPRSYREWLDAFETWSAAELPTRVDHPTIRLTVFGGGVALEATLRSVRAQTVPVECLVLDGPDAQAELLAAARGRTDYLGFLGAGEVLPPHAVSLAAAVLASTNRPELAIADEDELASDGERRAPSFRPTPNLPMMLSGALSGGLWLLRDDVVPTGLDAGFAGGPHGTGMADLVRLQIWLARRLAGRPNGVRIPHVLSSRGPNAERAPSDRVAAVVSSFLDRSGLPFHAAARNGVVRLRHDGRTALPSVTALVPSTLVAPHSERCLRSVIDGTDYPGLDVLVALSGPDCGGEAARLVADRLTAPGEAARVGRYPSRRFNFAETTNRAARDATGELLLLLNDDVVPIERGWLADMACWFADPRVGAVGARLLYPDGTIQHGGVVMGPATLCYHAFLGLDASAPDLPIRATLPQQLLAVTGACLLVRRSVWRALGGMDESYPSGFNDVDFCLRVSESGHEVILSDATLVHEESRTFGSHWSGDRAAFHRVEVERMQRRWSAYLADDPFYNPNLDLIAERMWCPAWPPRRSHAATAGGVRAPTKRPIPASA